jgi:tRNA(fMet)-specific endonuclease VapC
MVNAVHTISWLLDTNIISEAMRPTPNQTVLENLIRYENEIAIAAPVWHELRFGWLRMPEGQLKDAIGRYVQEVIGVLTILPYDSNAARIHAELRASYAQSGMTLPFVDGQIAAIAMANGLTLVTRNTKDFSHLTGLRITNWFTSSHYKKTP